MSGLYTISTRAAGTLISALIYNTDHQAHVDGRAAALMQSYGVSLGQMGLTEDPFPGSVESLPSALSGELSRLRFVIAALKGSLSGGTSVNWYDPIVAPGLATIGARVARSSSFSVPKGVATTINFTGASADFNSGMWEGVTHPSRFTAPADGKYYAACSGLWAASVSSGPSTRRQLRLGVNGSFTAQAARTSMTREKTAQYQTVSGLLNLSATDYVEFSAFQDSDDDPLSLVGDVPPGQSIVGCLVFLGS